MESFTAWSSDLGMSIFTAWASGNVKIVFWYPHVLVSNAKNFCTVLWLKIVDSLKTVWRDSLLCTLNSPESRSDIPFFGTADACDTQRVSLHHSSGTACKKVCVYNFQFKETLVHQKRRTLTVRAEDSKQDGLMASRRQLHMLKCLLKLEGISKATSVPFYPLSPKGTNR